MNKINKVATDALNVVQTKVGQNASQVAKDAAPVIEKGAEKMAAEMDTAATLGRLLVHEHPSSKAPNITIKNTSDFAESKIQSLKKRIDEIGSASELVRLLKDLNAYLAEEGKLSGLIDDPKARQYLEGILPISLIRR